MKQKLLYSEIRLTLRNVF